ncbi:MAG: bacterial/archaeal transporter family-2 protein [Nocardioidaceae bacterium]|nr:bacterial/archaeal transporter family-2 protein [Nocardioidaceae bacterium]
MLLGGGLVACQSQINSRLAHHLGSGLRAGALAATISFGSGLVVLTLAVVTVPRGRRGVRDLREALRAHRLRPVELVGGLLGAFFVASQSISVGTIGVALFIVAVTAGQSANSLAVDHIGLSPRGRQAVTPPRVIAAVFAVVAVILTAGERLATDASALVLGLAILAFGAGTLQPVQQALNGRVAAVGGPLATTWNNFLVGTIALLAFLAISFTVHGHIRGLPHAWWLYVGGLCGVVFISLASWTVRIHGVLILGLCTIAGQVVTAELIDVLGSDSHVGVLGVLGGALTIVGVLIALLLRPKDTHKPAVELSHN